MIILFIFIMLEWVCYKKKNMILVEVNDIFKTSKRVIDIRQKIMRGFQIIPIYVAKICTSNDVGSGIKLPDP